MKILVIDDNKDITELLVKVFGILGHDIKATNDGREGLKLITNNSFDVVFLDIAMPDFSGLDVINNLKETDAKIVLFTASSITDDEINKLPHVHSCLRKPIKIETLIAKINEITKGDALNV